MCGTVSFYICGTYCLLGDIFCTLALLDTFFFLIVKGNNVKHNSVSKPEAEFYFNLFSFFLFSVNQFCGSPFFHLVVLLRIS